MTKKKSTNKMKEAAAGGFAEAGFFSSIISGALQNVAGDALYKVLAAMVALASTLASGAYVAIYRHLYPELTWWQYICSYFSWLFGWL
jgi:hypothetical protein